MSKAKNKVLGLRNKLWKSSRWYDNFLVNFFIDYVHDFEEIYQASRGRHDNNTTVQPFSVKFASRWEHFNKEKIPAIILWKKNHVNVGVTQTLKNNMI